MTELKAWYTLAEFAEMTGQKLETVRTQRKRGHIPARRYGHKWIIYLDELRRNAPELWASIMTVDQFRNR